jgi:hypothetical protein
MKPTSPFVSFRHDPAPYHAVCSSATTPFSQVKRRDCGQISQLRTPEAFVAYEFIAHVEHDDAPLAGV